MIDNFSILVCGLVIVYVIFKARQRHIAERTVDKRPKPQQPPQSSPPQQSLAAKRPVVKP